MCVNAHLPPAVRLLPFLINDECTRSRAAQRAPTLHLLRWWAKGPASERPS